MNSPWPSDGLCSGGWSLLTFVSTLGFFFRDQTNGSNRVKHKEIKWYFYVLHFFSLAQTRVSSWNASGVLTCSRNFPGKKSLSEVAQSQSVCLAAKWINFQKLRSNWNWVIKGNKLSKLNCKGHYQFLPQRKKGSGVIQTQLVVMGEVARGKWGFV